MSECQDIPKKSVPGYSKKGKIGGKLAGKGLVEITLCMAAVERQPQGLVEITLCMAAVEITLCMAAKVHECTRAARHAEFVC